MFHQQKYRLDANGITFMHVSEGQLYAATVADFSGGEPLIHREKIRTERSDLNQLNGNGRHANCIRIFPPSEHNEMARPLSRGVKFSSVALEFYRVPKFQLRSI